MSSIQRNILPIDRYAKKIYRDQRKLPIIPEYKTITPESSTDSLDFRTYDTPKGSAVDSDFAYYNMPVSRSDIIDFSRYHSAKSKPKETDKPFNGVKKFFNKYFNCIK